MEQLEKEIRYIELHFGIFRIRGRENKVHNITILIGLVVCMLAGFTTVTAELLPKNPMKTLRMFRSQKPGSRRGKDEILDFELCY